MKFASKFIHGGQCTFVLDLFVNVIPMYCVMLTSARAPTTKCVAMLPVLAGHDYDLYTCL